jgi:hypothetical protein
LRRAAKVFEPVGKEVREHAFQNPASV